MAFPSNVASFVAQTTTVKVVKPTSGRVAGWYIYNPNSSVAYVQFFDVASGGTLTLGTTAPLLTIGVPATAAANLLDGNGLNFKNGIQLAATTTATGSTAPSSGLDVNVFYQ